MKSVESLLRNSASYPEVLESSLLSPFGDVQIDFLSNLSKRLLKPNGLRSFPELVALGYWLRPTNLEHLRVKYVEKTSSNDILKPRGTALHFAPSNVDTICIYSWALSLLCGNRNVIRVTTNRSQQLSELLDCVNQVLAESNEFDSIAKSTAVVSYLHDATITNQLSSQADVRVIWGGDATVAAIRRSPLPPTATEITFADKRSVAILSSASWSQASSDLRSEVAKKFVLDAFSFDQLACSSPRMVIWVGEEPHDGAREVFWNLVQSIAVEKFPALQDISVVDKLVASCLAASQFPCRQSATENNRVTRVGIESNSIADSLYSDFHCGSGLFFETAIANLGELTPAMSRKVQTLSYFGIAQEDLRDFISHPGCTGLDRVVPIGESLQFQPVWDGIDLLESFSRRVMVQ